MVHCPGLEAGANGRSDFINAEMIADAIPHDSSGFAADPARGVALLQELHRVVGPQELDQHTRISAWIRPGTPQCVESKRLMIRVNVQHTPP